MNFKVGQKVVYIGSLPAPEWANEPQKNEIVTISREDEVKGYFHVIEYPLNKEGDFQSIRQDQLRPLDEAFADEVLERVKEQINEEELVLI